ncbi:bifunctional glutamate N-acetyltransferase/amino-acid acetyltransferase ArgJ [Tumebacillus sp. DT12]|uniref:Arginine biosynthesis bifunctional protein ArgJ n=1 Tax=Tumebacillus lacus TaxID=2995335 RepID=A0ABT3X545_9BACL|nr:bifunctional glutamate N-acetyltransferase/amino-acid acetyltransferase ArgJ [Tumebacillus lacus]MCX7572024.1 bifunctional glutamate N-acetyltransferase/amino-acid acetyltransferase ArgJ [Tumebacillus lacus]
MSLIIQQTFTVLEKGTVTAPQGYKAAGLHAGIKKKRKDIALIVSEVPAAAAGVFTTNLVRAACVTQNEAQLKEVPYLQAIVINSGNANACTGAQGEADALTMRNHTAQELGLPEHGVAIASTGVIGVQMPMVPLLAGISQATEELSVAGGEDFAQAILTTDTGSKEIAVQLTVDGRLVTLGGAAKGSGMIHPNMATMLAFVTTDAAVEPAALQTLLRRTTDQTYNRITVDGDTSTNDMVLVMANGLAGNAPLGEQHPQWEEFAAAFRYVSEKLAKDIARDGEGATKLIEVIVQGAASERIASQIAKSIIGSSLVKTAVYGADANWGRILAAAGYSGAPFDPARVDIWLGSIQVAEGGMGLLFDEEAAKEYLLGDPVTITVDLHQGDHAATAYGCDLTYDYVRINASYRT